MKLLETPSLEHISALLSGERGNSQLDMRLESYSLKMAGTDKKLFKQISIEGMPQRLLRTAVAPREHSPSSRFLCFV